jgi:hypothetical protein
LAKLRAKFWSALFLLINATFCFFQQFITISYSIQCDFDIFPGSQKVIGSIPTFYTLIIRTLQQCNVFLIFWSALEWLPRIEISMLSCHFGLLDIIFLIWSSLIFHVLISLLYCELFSPNFPHFDEFT